MATKTGLGLAALIPPKEQKVTPAPAKPKTKRLQKEKAKPQAIQEGVEAERRTTWVREEHMVRLETLKLRERARLRKEGKRVSVASLIDEALGQYLDEMGV